MDIETEFALFSLEHKFARQLLENRLVHDELMDCATLTRIESELRLWEVVMATHKLIGDLLALQAATGGDRREQTQSGGLAQAANPAETLTALAFYLKRIADHFDPPPPDIVDSPYVASLLGCTTQWIADMTRRGELPKNCVVPGTGNGKVWKFYRTRIEEWLATR